MNLTIKREEKVKMKSKKLLALALSAVMVLSLAACGGDKEGGEATGTNFPGTPDEDTYVVDFRAEPPELNSVLTTDVTSGTVLRLVISGLYRLDKNDQPVPDLAEETTVSEDGRTYTMKLRQDSKWSNGEPVTAHDFVFAYQTICDPKTGSQYAYIVYDNLLNGNEVYEGTMSPDQLGVKALDDYTLEVTFENPIPYAEHLLSFASYYPLNEKAYKEIGADVYGDDPDKIVTNGAYSISEWVHEDHITLTANEDFYDPDRCAVKNVKFLMLKDSNARMNAFQGGEVDVVNLTGDQMEQAKELGIHTESYVDNSVWYLQYNLQKTDKGLDNVNIRKALMYGIDTKELCDNILKDGSVPATGYVPTSINGGNGELYRDYAGDIIEPDIEGAKEYLEKGLEETGLSVEDLNGIAILTDDTDQARRTCQFLQEQWKANLGIEVSINQQPFKNRLDAMQSGDFDVVLAGWVPDYNDPMTYVDMFMTTNGNNYGKYSNEQYDSLLTQAMKEGDFDKRIALIAEAEQLGVVEDAVVAPIYFQSTSYAVSDKVKNMTRTGFQEFDFTDALDK